jgi:hypothetical protein
MITLTVNRKMMKSSQKSDEGKVKNTDIFTINSLLKIYNLLLNICHLKNDREIVYDLKVLRKSEQGYVRKAYNEQEKKRGLLKNRPILSIQFQFYHKWTFRKVPLAQNLFTSI